MLAPVSVADAIAAQVPSPTYCCRENLPGLGLGMGFSALDTPQTVGRQGTSLLGLFRMLRPSHQIGPLMKSESRILSSSSLFSVDALAVEKEWSKWQQVCQSLEFVDASFALVFVF